jgi:hypothetical protein
MEDLRFLYDREDFRQVWLQVATEIKIRTYDKLNDIPEFDVLPSGVQNKIKCFAKGVKFNYETFYDEGNVYSAAYVVLIIQENQNWLGMFPYHYATTLSKAVMSLFGCGVLVGGVYYFCSAAPKYLQPLIDFISKNSEKVLAGLAGLASQLFTKEALTSFMKWLTNDNSAWNFLVAACILRKLQGVRGN